MEKNSFMSLQNGSDIRGVAEGDNPLLSALIAGRLGRAFARLILARTGKRPFCPFEPARVAVGFDPRPSGRPLARAFCDGIAAEGVTPYATGISTTPAMFMGCMDSRLAADGGVMVTASHLPADRNGFKFFTPSGGLGKKEITALLEDAFALDPPAPAELPLYYDLMASYVTYLVERVQEWTGKEFPLTGRKILVDAGGGSGGFYVGVLERLGADTAGSLYIEPDPAFSGHIPNPEENSAMEALSAAVVSTGADFGIAFDTDADRAGLVGPDGRLINHNRMIALAAAVIAPQNKGGVIVTDSVTSTGLGEFITSLGLVHRRFKRGYKNVIDEALRLCESGVHAPLAIETSGHAAMRENFFLDDGAYLVTRMLPMLAVKGPGELIAGLREPAESVSLRIPAEKLAADSIERLADFAKKTPGLSLTPDNYEGVRVDCDKARGNGWALLRRSLHDPLFVLDMESDSPGGIAVMKEVLSPILCPLSQSTT